MFRQRLLANGLLLGIYALVAAGIVAVLRDHGESGLTTPLQAASPTNTDSGFRAAVSVTGLALADGPQRPVSEAASDRPSSKDAGVSSSGLRLPESTASADPQVAARQKAIPLGVNSSLHGLRPFPDDNPWNQDISKAAVDPLSMVMLASIGLDKGLHPAFGSGEWDGSPIGIPYVVVSGDQPGVPVEFTDYGDESDAGPYPIPAGAPIESFNDPGADRHVLILDRDNWKLYELFHAFETGGRWKASSGAIWDLTSNKGRPVGITSADAAGLPVFPGLVRYDEVEAGEIRHALRFTVSRTRRAFVPPASHWASRETSPALPPMGLRVRLKQDVDINGYPKHVQVILRCLKTYGMILADNGSDWFVTGVPDERWDNDALHTIKKIKGRDLEVVEMKGLVADW